MMKLALLTVVILFPVSEVVLMLVKRSKSDRSQDEDRGSMRLLWACITIGVMLGIAGMWVPSARVPLPPRVLQALSLCLLAGGLALRWAAIVQLGRLFTVDISIQPGHVVFQRGLYRLVRHPSYTGLFAAFGGLALFYGNWISTVGLLVPIGIAILHRVYREERALLKSLGPEYAAYCARTKRFIPWVL
jgi:protein-S-isoprenylcysteine O-methyltransferase Ste14